MAIVYLGLGSNMGDRQQYIRSALDALRQSGISIDKTSTIIETEPQGGPPQGNYLNAVCESRTDLTPEELLSAVKSIERRLGRRKNVVNGPREIDIDILLYDQLRWSSLNLTIPHPRMRHRAFVLEPLKEIAPSRADIYLHENR